jgi:hypothetical protein
MGKNPLNSNISFEKSFLTDLLFELIKKKLKVIPMDDDWLELRCHKRLKFITL